MTAPLTRPSMDDDSSWAGIDPDRGTVTIPRRLVPVLLALHAGNPVCNGEQAELELSGITSAGRLHPAVTGILGVMMEPGLVVSVDVAGGRAPTLATFWCTRRRAVQGEVIDSQRVRLHRVDPERLSFHLLQVTGAGPRPSPPFAGGVTVDARLLEEIERLLGDQASMAALEEAGIDPLWADRLLIALEHRRRAWRVQTVWTGRSNGRRTAELTVLDAGPAGYWRMSGTPPALTLTVSDYDDLVLAFRDLLPDPEP